MALDDFWSTIDLQLDHLTAAQDADEVISILATADNPYGDPDISSAPGFFAGSGGDRTVAGALQQAGWTFHAKASYWWVATAPDGQSAISYTEGDIHIIDPAEVAA